MYPPLADRRMSTRPKPPPYPKPPRPPGEPPRPQPGLDALQRPINADGLDLRRPAVAHPHPRAVIRSQATAGHLPLPQVPRFAVGPGTQRRRVPGPLGL